MAQGAEIAVARTGLNLPAAASFPRQPATWYVLCRSRDIGRDPISATVARQQVAAFRDERGRVDFRWAATLLRSEYEEPTP
jgi:hypothetical protein